MKYLQTLVRHVQGASDKALTMFVPQTRAAADNFTQYCGCYASIQHDFLSYWFRTCAFVDPSRSGGPYTCLPCYDSLINC